MSVNWKETLGKVAPTVAAALGGPFAGVAVNMACDALGLSESSESALQSAIAGGNPDVLVKLKQIELDFEAKMAEIGLKREELQVEDRKSARSLATAKGIGVQATLTFIITFAFSWILFLLFEGDTKLTKHTENIAFYAMGTLNGLLIQAYNFWFGTSKGSKDKTEALQGLKR